MGDWLTIIIVLLILGILLDGWRRMRNAQRDSLKVSRYMRKSASASSKQRDDYNSAELPNGGARVVAYRESSEAIPGESTVRTRTRSSAARPQETPAWEEVDEGLEYEEQAFLEEPEQEQPGQDEPNWRETPSNAEPVSDEQIENAQVDAAHSAMPHRSRASHSQAPEDDEAEPDFPEEHEPVAEVPEFQEPEPPRRPRSRAASDSRGRIPQQVALNLDESVPILMETTEEEEPQRSEQDSLGDSDRIEPTFGGARRKQTATQTHHEAETPARAKSKPSFGSALGASLSNKAMQAKEAFSAKLANSGLRQNVHSQEEDEPVAQQAPPRNKPPEETAAPAQAPRARTSPKTAPSAPPQPEEVLVVNIMAPQGEQFRGTALLDALIQAGLRYGDMNIFHRYQEARGGGPILFSLANMVKPGIFDLDTMDQFSTPGVSLFMTLPLDNARQGNVEVFELMLDSARAIADDLGGELKDENRSVMTRQTMEHCRQRIHEFERKQLSRAPS